MSQHPNTSAHTITHQTHAAHQHTQHAQTLDLHVRTRSLRKTVLSRAYLNFVDPSAVYDFKAKFDGHAFITTKGSQFKCAVEYAPFQKVPNPPKKRNPLEGTIEQGNVTRVVYRLCVLLAYKWLIGALGYEHQMCINNAHILLQVHLLLSHTRQPVFSVLCVSKQETSSC